MTASHLTDTGIRNDRRYQMTQILGDFARELLSELEHYEECFTATEVKEAKKIAERTRRLRDHVETN